MSLSTITPRVAEAQWATNLSCPLCDWTSPSERAAFVIPHPGDYPYGLTVDMKNRLPEQVAGCVRRDARTRRDHLSTHGPDEWEPALSAATAAARPADVVVVDILSAAA